MNKVGYLGIPGSYSHLAANKYFKGQKFQLEGMAAFKDIFEAIKEGKLTHGVIPIENTLAGSLYENYDLLDAHSISVVGECYVKIEHNLLVTDEGMAAFKNKENRFTVYSHPKALEQCTAFLDQQRFSIRSFGDTANAAKFVAQQQESNAAAIASKEAAKLYGLHVAMSSIQTNKENYTRFLVVGSKVVTTKEANKCSLILYMPHVKGSLYNALGVLVQNECNLMKIESRPLIGKPFEYVFYFDFQYDSKQHDVDQIIADLHKTGAKPVLLGVYRSDSLG